MNFHLQLEAIRFELLFIYWFFLGKKDVFELSWLVGWVNTFPPRTRSYQVNGAS